ncbi:hypothetical protein F4802DRAFT_602848 [Xylaria palmicola]|nr:hypothetical protein F4802DRAFT_602848 [Xylaria palmicola]
MEEPETPGTLPRAVQPPPPPSPSPPPPPPPPPHPPFLTSPSSTPRLTNSEPSPGQPAIEPLSDSVLSLRFPRPVGNRQLTNWVSSSSPDIMQPGNVPDMDASLAELGYDVIGTDGESQAESVASSFDYQRSDDIQSLTDTDVETDSSDEEETTLNETILSDATLVDQAHHDDDAEAETLDMVGRSLENPTSLSSLSNSPFASVSYIENVRTHDPSAVIRTQTSEDEYLAPLEGTLVGHLIVKESENSPSRSPETPPGPKALQSALGYLYERRWALATLAGLFLCYGFALLAKSLMLQPSVPLEISTVPVASVPVVVQPPPMKTTYSIITSKPTALPTSNALQTTSSSNSHAFIPFMRDKKPTDVATIPLPAAVCSAEQVGRGEILIRIPEHIKASWLAKDAILIAVSRGLQDIPTKVSSVADGLVIRVPLPDAHGVLAVTMATTHKPRINESFRINFGAYRFTEALDAGKQLVRGFAQRVADTVNGTTLWVEETYMPALDGVSKQVCDQTASISGSVLHGLQETADSIMAVPSRLLARIQRSLDFESWYRRIGQLRLELTRETLDVRDELRMAVLKSQVTSRLLWLKMQGKTKAHGRYLSKVEVFLREQRALAERARVERAERTKQQIGAWHERDHVVPPKATTLWRTTMRAWAGLWE